jgi:hypothetical protein
MNKKNIFRVFLSIITIIISIGSMILLGCQFAAGNNNAINTFIVKEYFEYGNTSTDIISVSSGKWSIIHGGTSALDYLATTGLSYTNYSSGHGGCLNVTNETTNDEIVFTFPAKSDGTFYLSFLMKPTVLTNAMSSTNLGPVIGLMNGTNKVAYVKTIRQGDMWMPGPPPAYLPMIIFGWSAVFLYDVSDASYTPAGNIISVDTTYLIVLKIDLDQHLISFFKDPDMLSSEPSSPDVTMDISMSSGIDRIFINCNSLNYIVGEGNKVIFDEIRLVNSWHNLTKD